MFNAAPERRGRAHFSIVALVIGGALATGCGSEGSASSAALTGRIEIDGSSTVGPLMTLTAADIRDVHPAVDITVDISGTGGGFTRFCAGKTDVSNASRPISDEEIAACRAAGVEYERLVVANDAVSVVVNRENTWADCLTIDQLATMWEPSAEGVVTRWNQIDPSYPDVALDLYGPGSQSGTFDYFTDVVNGETGASRTDYNASEDDFITVSGIEAHPGALGYFGFSYLEGNLDRIRPVAIDSGAGCVLPSAQAVADSTYSPFSRPLYIYVKATSADRPEVQEFVRYYVDHQDTLTIDALFVPLTEEQRTTEQAAEVAALLG